MEWTVDGDNSELSVRLEEEGQTRLLSENAFEGMMKACGGDTAAKPCHLSVLPDHAAEKTAEEAQYCLLGRSGKEGMLVV